MNTDNGAFAAFAGFGFIGFLLALVIAVGVVWLQLWILYTVIWRGVRRGLAEFYSRRPPVG